MPVRPLQALNALVSRILDCAEVDAYLNRAGSATVELGLQVGDQIHALIKSAALLMEATDPA